MFLLSGHVLQIAKTKLILGIVQYFGLVKTMQN